MIVLYYDYEIEILNDPNYTLGSADNLTSYQIEYSSLLRNEDRTRPTSKHGIRLKKNGIEISSAIICESWGATTIHDKSFIIRNDSILICCCDKIYSLRLPELKMKWMKRLDPVTCFGIYAFENDFIIHGEMHISRIDENGTVKWEFGGRDIFVNVNGKKEFELINNQIKLIDFENHEYLLNGEGKEIS